MPLQGKVPTSLSCFTAALVVHHLTHRFHSFLFFDCECHHDGANPEHYSYADGYREGEYVGEPPRTSAARPTRISAKVSQVLAFFDI